MKIKNIKKDNYSITLITVSDEDGSYIHSRILVDGYSREALFRITDKKNGEDLTLVGIDYGFQHDTIMKEFYRIEEVFKDIAIKHMEDTYFKAFNRPYNCTERKQVPLPLIKAYGVALQALHPLNK